MTYPIPIEHIKSLWIERINKAFEEQMLLVLGGSTQMERDTWSMQLAAAQARLAGTSTAEQNALLSAICAGGETADTLAMGIIGKARVVETIIGVALGIKRRAEKAIEAATTHEEIDAAIQIATEESKAAFAAIMGD